MDASSARAVKGFQVWGTGPSQRLQRLQKASITTRIITITGYSLQHREKARAFAMCLESSVIPQLYYGCYWWVCERYSLTNAIRMTF